MKQLACGLGNLFRNFGNVVGNHLNTEMIKELMIIMSKRGEEVGVRINVQVKCGGSYVSSHNDNHIKFRFKSKGDLEKHLSYWKKQIEPCILVLVNPCNKNYQKIKR